MFRTPALLTTLVVVLASSGCNCGKPVVTTTMGSIAIGSEVLDFYQTNDLELWENIIVLIGFVFGLRFIAYLILRSRGPKYDKSI